MKIKQIGEIKKHITEKNVPTDPDKWAYAKAQAKKKFDVYPSAYANGWASKKYKELGGSWRKEESVTEVDVNDPMMIKLRAAQMQRKADALKKAQPKKYTINPDWEAGKNAKKIHTLKKQRAQIMRDMEQEAEPSGGRIADKYGRMLDKIDKEIIKLGGSPMGESTNEELGHSEVRRIEKGLSSIDKQKLANDIKSGKIKNSDDLKKWVSSLHTSVNESNITKTFKFPKSITSTKFDEIDADLSRAGIQSEPNFNTNTIKVSGDMNKIMRIVNKYKGIEEGLNESTEPEIITQLRDVMKSGYKSLKDPKSGKKMKVDSYSASAIVKVYDALNQTNKDKFSKLGLIGMQNVAFKVLNK